MAKKKAKTAKKRQHGPTPSKNPRLPVHWRIRKETLARLSEQAIEDRRNVNQVAEILIEKGLGLKYDSDFNPID